MTDPESLMLVENMLLMRKEDFDDLLDRAAERGAERALSHLGLESSGNTLSEVRAQLSEKHVPFRKNSIRADRRIGLFPTQ